MIIWCSAEMTIQPALRTACSIIIRSHAMDLSGEYGDMFPCSMTYIWLPSGVIFGTQHSREVICSGVGAQRRTM